MVEPEQRFRNKEAFLAGDHKWFVATPDVGGEGITLLNGLTNVYYSNGFKLVQRLQSEDRSHRIGQRNPVLYIDQIAEDTIDMHIVEALVKKRDISSQVLGDEIFQWIKGA
jgi:SNF2 family DNA or RNA helicase